MVAPPPPSPRGPRPAALRTRRITTTLPSIAGCWSTSNDLLAISLHGLRNFGKLRSNSRLWPLRPEGGGGGEGGLDKDRERSRGFVGRSKLLLPRAAARSVRRIWIRRWTMGEGNDEELKGESRLEIYSVKGTILVWRISFVSWGYWENAWRVIINYR